MSFLLVTIVVKQTLRVGFGGLTAHVSFLYPQLGWQMVMVIWIIQQVWQKLFLIIWQRFQGNQNWLLPDTVQLKILSLAGQPSLYIWILTVSFHKYCFGQSSIAHHVDYWSKFCVPNGPLPFIKDLPVPLQGSGWSAKPKCLLSISFSARLF